mmetsp:Transcript_3834/g.8743  ORF Transcript_3834/g.8743 Transcript_3834/m.8743 type:complete len:516 (-) Transcript_3834:451-1998(-)
MSTCGTCGAALAGACVSPIRIASSSVKSKSPIWCEVGGTTAADGGIARAVSPLSTPAAAADAAARARAAAAFWIAPVAFRASDPRPVPIVPSADDPSTPSAATPAPLRLLPASATISGVPGGFAPAQLEFAARTFGTASGKEPGLTSAIVCPYRTPPAHATKRQWRPRSAVTRIGDATACVCPRPSCPEAFCPHARTSPAEVTAIECDPLADTLAISGRPLMIVGLFRSFADDPRPSCPSLPHPNAQISPLEESARVCEEPHATCRMPFPNSSLTGRGSLFLLPPNKSQFPWPSCPYSSHPHENTSFLSVEVSATVCASPHATSEICVPCSRLTSAGVERDVSSPCPSCPLTPQPHVYTWPVSVETVVCADPHATRATVMPSSAATRSGVEKLTDGAPCPSCPKCPHPHDHTVPAVPTATVCAEPHETRETTWPSNDSRMRGRTRLVTSPCPSCPCVPRPHANTSPCSDSASECSSPASTCTILMPSSPLMMRGSHCASPCGPCPVWPYWLYPHE